MNIKEAFRYQKFLERLMDEAGQSLCTYGHMLATTKKHCIKEANSDAEDKTETVDEGVFFKNDDVIKFMQRVIDERTALTRAINKAKRNLAGPIDDMDAANETNRFRREAASRIKSMLKTKAGKKIERGTGYKFNAEGAQMPYFYNIEVETKENFDRPAAKKVMQELLKAADATSAALDEVQVNTSVDYNAPWDVNDSFEDVMTEFVAAAAEGSESEATS